eukprot:SAG11_NODE_2235_length_3653_cov_20.005346_1_plen_152_part_00
MSFYRALGTSIQLSTARHQRTDGQTERAIAYATECLRMGISYKQDNWSSLLPKVQFNINSSLAKSKGMSPIYCEKGRHPIMPLDLVDLDKRGPITNTETQEHLARMQTIDREVHERMTLARQYQAKHFNRRVREQSNLLVPGALHGSIVKG